MKWRNTQEIHVVLPSANTKLLFFLPPLETVLQIVYLFFISLKKVAELQASVFSLEVKGSWNLEQIDLREHCNHLTDCYFVISFLIRSRYINESRIVEVELTNNIPLITSSAIAQGGSLNFFIRESFFPFNCD